MKITGFVAACVLVSSAIAAPAFGEPEARISPFSGKPVPRFESLRYATVHGRTGPSLEYAIAWRYEREGLPVMILEESPEGRRVRDPEGAEVWIHARMLSSTQTGMVAEDATLKRGIDPKSSDMAIIQAGVIVDILETRQDWFKVRKAGPRNSLTGWVKQAEVWGDTSR